MFNKEFLNDLSNRISGLVPMAEAVRKDVENSIEELLESTFSRLNLVTREEFEAQQKVLERAEATITRLEEKIAGLEREQGISTSADPEPGKQ